MWIQNVNTKMWRQNVTIKCEEKMWRWNVNNKCEYLRWDDEHADEALLLHCKSEHTCDIRHVMGLVVCWPVQCFFTIMTKTEISVQIQINNQCFDYFVKKFWGTLSCPSPLPKPQITHFMVGLSIISIDLSNQPDEHANNTINYGNNLKKHYELLGLPWVERFAVSLVQ